jgi:hypothetical protein
MASAASSVTRPNQLAPLEALPPALAQLIDSMAGPESRVMASASRTLQQSLQVNPQVRSCKTRTFGFEMTDAGLQHMVQTYPNLTTLKLRGAHITNLAPLQRLHSLQKLELEYCDTITNDAIRDLRALPIQELCLKGCVSIKPADLIRPGALPPSLRTLDFGICDLEVCREIHQLKDSIANINVKASWVPID